MWACWTKVAALERDEDVHSQGLRTRINELRDRLIAEHGAVWP